MPAKPIMNPATINTILNTAPLVIKGATRLIRLIRNQGEDGEAGQEIPATLEGLQREVERLQQRLDDTNKSNIEQVKLIEELARQNASLAAQLKSTMAQLQWLKRVSVAVLIVAVACLSVALVARG